MNLGIFLSPGDSLKLMAESGQDERFINIYLKKYSKNFEKVYVFSYANEQRKIGNSIYIIPKKSNLHRILYGILLPLINKSEIKNCDVIRGFGLASAISSIFLTRPFVFNWAYNYIEFVKIERKPLYIPFYFLLEKFALLKAANVFIATKPKFKNLRGKKKFIYLPNGVDLRVFKNKGKGKGLIYVGRLEEQKNLFFLLDAVSYLPKKNREITFIGSGSQKDLLAKYAIKKQIKLSILKPIKNSLLPKFLGKFAVFVLASLSEGSPKVLLEAMAAGLAPVVNNFATAADIIIDGKNGFLINYDKKDFAQKLMLLLNNTKHCAKISKNATVTIKNNFNQEKLINQEINTLKKAANNP
jgi:glycosyltransferase involved in cell wall biosynthesis